MYCYGLRLNQRVHFVFFFRGYCDLDIVIGNLPLFIEHAELATQDIVSYSFGDVDALYLRGQW